MCIRCEDDETLRMICEEIYDGHAIEITVVDDVPFAECIRCGRTFGEE